MAMQDLSASAYWRLRVRMELWNINRNAPVFPGDTLSHATANECVRRGWAKRDSQGYFVPIDWPAT